MIRRLIRISAVLGALWSLLVAGFVCLVGAFMSMTDAFNGSHTGEFVIVGLLEVVLLFSLVQAYRLRTWVAAVLLFWFALVSILPSPPAGEWFKDLLNLLTLLAPVTLTMVLLMVYGFRLRSQEGSDS